MTRIPLPYTRRLARFCVSCLCALALLAGPVDADAPPEPARLVADDIAAWKAFYPSQAFGYGDAGSAAAFEDFDGERVPQWLALNARAAAAADALLADSGLDVQTRTDLQMLRAQAIGEQADWREDEPLSSQPQWYAEQVSQARTTV